MTAPEANGLRAGLQRHLQSGPRGLASAPQLAICRVDATEGDGLRADSEQQNSEAAADEQGCVAYVVR